jgi:putative flippase GtrA
MTGSARPLVRRWIAFNAVGAMGIVIQLSVLAVLTARVGLHYLAATAIAVEVSVLHNFVWHECWTWSDRKSVSGLQLFCRFARFNFANGALSIFGNLAVMKLLVGALALNYLPANLLAIAACSILNFAAGECFVFSARQPLLRPSHGRDRS